MPTAIEIIEDKKFVESQGLDMMLLNKPRATGTWYRADGKALPNLPVDPYHRTIYRKKGWALKPPEHPIPVKRVEAPAPLTAALQKEVAEIIKVKPPRHIHVFQVELGSPCLVLGCDKVRQNLKVKWESKGKTKK